jgi:predicted ATPase
MASINERQREILRGLFAEARARGSYSQDLPFESAREEDNDLMEELVSSGLVSRSHERFQLTLEGLRASAVPEAQEEVETAATLIGPLQDQYRRRGGSVTAVELAERSKRSTQEVRRVGFLLRSLPIWSAFQWDPEGFLGGELKADVLFFSGNDVVVPPVADDDLEAAHEDEGERRLAMLEIDGYRPFRAFKAELGALTVIIGANATGKSSLFDFLRFVRHAASYPLPAEIDPRSAGKTLFHAGGPERVAFELTLDLGRRTPLEYQAEILGPVGAPRVARERLTTARSPGGDTEEPFVFLNFTAGRGVLRDRRGIIRPGWNLKPNELALRRALDPTLVTSSRVQALLSSWRFFSGFDVSANAAIRRPVQIEPDPELLEDGSNLGAVLMWLNREHQPAWEELETHLRSTVPGFLSLNVVPRGGPGMVIGLWKEQGVPGELTLADLSDGTLRFLCWASLLLSPKLPPLICIDEPEIGLHPRVLPVLAGLIRQASARAQILVATHSPHFLSHFQLEEIAVMRKEDGAPRFVRPASSTALREMVDEIGGEAIAKLHLSDELETLP